MFDYEENAVQRFIMDAFRFLEESAGAVVYLHCSVEACRKGDNSSRCAQGCIQSNSRKRRSLELDAVSQQTVSIGPVTAEDFQPQEQGERPSRDCVSGLQAQARVTA